jgi:CheY-like chemotaxis protein
LLRRGPDAQGGARVSELQTAAADQHVIPIVLIADANPDSCARRSRQLHARGFRVVVARTPFEAIVKASCHLPDLILVDASLEDGANETTNLLSTCPVTAHIPIVRLRGGRRLPARFRAQGMGQRATA